MNKKYAILFSGQPRFRQMAVESIINNIIDINDCDVFGYFWKYDDYHINFKAIADIANVRDDIDFKLFNSHIESLKKTFNFKSIVVEEQINFNPDKYHPGDEKSKVISQFGPVVADQHFKRCNFIIQSQWYSLYRSNQLKCEYEKSNGFKYDGVLRFRPDVYVKEKMLLDYYDSNKLNIPHYSPHNISNTDVLVVSDIISYGSSDILDKYCNFYNTQNDILKDVNYIGDVEYDALLGNPISLHIRDNIGNDNVICNSFNFSSNPVHNIIRTC